MPEEDLRDAEEEVPFFEEDDDVAVLLLEFEAP